MEAWSKCSMSSICSPAACILFPWYLKPGSTYGFSRRHFDNFFFFRLLFVCQLFQPKPTYRERGNLEQPANIWKWQANRNGISCCRCRVCVWMWLLQRFSNGNHNLIYFSFGISQSINVHYSHVFTITNTRKQKMPCTKKVDYNYFTVRMLCD